jgi:hypothetical protein
LAADLARVAVACVLAVVAALLISFVSPQGLVDAERLLGPYAFLYFCSAAVVLLAAGLWIGVHALRWVYFALLATTLGLLLLATCVGIAAAVLAAPGLIGGTMRLLALLVAPWAAAIMPLGFGLHGALRARQLHARKNDRRPFFAFAGAAAIGVVAAAWVLIGSLPSVDEVAEMPPPPVEAKAVDQVRRFTVIVEGARRLADEPPATAVDRPKHGAAAAVAAVNKPKPK